MTTQHRSSIPNCIVASLLFLIVSPVGAVTPEEFASVVNFDGSIEQLSSLVRSGREAEIDLERFYILEGAVASTIVFSADPATFQAVIELVESRWVDLRTVEMYRIYVVVTDPSFAARLPERLPRDPGPEVIRANQELLVVGSYVGTSPPLESGDSAEQIPVIQAVAIR